MPGSIIITEEADIKILSDPYRIRILDTFKSFGRPATVKQVADRLGDTAAKVTFHVKKLIGLGLLTLDHTEMINGIMAKFYELTYDTIHVEPKDASRTVEFRPMLDTLLRMLQQDLRNLSGSQAQHSLLSHETVYLTDEQALAYREAMMALVKGNHEPREGARPYASYHALLLKQDAAEATDMADVADTAEEANAAEGSEMADAADTVKEANAANAANQEEPSDTADETVVGKNSDTVRPS